MSKHFYNKLMLVGSLALIIIIAGYVARYTSRPSEVTPPEMKIELNNTNWNTSTDTTSHVSFKYPETLGTTYISTVDWPPQVQVTSDTFACIEAGTQTERAGKTTHQTINGTEYCITRVSEGAAGSTYTNYAYAKAWDTGIIIFTFSLRFPQCLNYDEPKSSACIAEQSAFDPDTILDQVIQTAAITS